MRTYLFLITIVCLYACSQQKEKKGELLIGEWISFRTESLVANKIDAFGVGDSLETFYSVKQRFEFRADGIGRELTLSPNQIFPFTWEVKKDILMFYDRKYKIEKITADSLVLSEFDRNEIEYVDPNPNTPFSQRIYFKRTKQ